MRVLGNLSFAGLGQIENLRVENLALDPVSPAPGSVWYNTAEGVYKGFDGTEVITFASGGNTELIVNEVNAIETSVGLNADGTFAQHTDTNYINAAESMKAADKLLDSQVKLNSDAIDVLETSSGAIAIELDATQAAAGLNADGSYTAPVGSNFVGAALNLKEAIVALDDQAKVNADGIADNAEAIDTKVSKAGDAMSGNLAFGGTSKIIGLAAGTNAGDAINKAQLDAAVAGFTWENAVDGLVEDHTAIATPITIGQRFANTTENKIFTATAAGADGATAEFDAGETLVDGAAFFDKSDETGYVFNGVELVQFTGGGQLTAGVGLVKVGNVIDVNLGAGIGQLPSDEVGIDVLVAGGLFLTVDGATASVDGAAQLSVKLDGATLSRSATGVKVSAAGVTAVELATSVAGNGIAGGAGTALNVVADTGIVVSETGVALDLEFADSRFINVDGDAMTGALMLAADPVEALEAATKQYVDALSAKLDASTFVYDGSVAGASHVVTHNLGSQFANVTVIDSANKVILPDSITFDSANQLTVGFSSAITCKVVVSGKKVVA